MRKTKEYISDVQQKIIELHKLESVFKKRARAVKVPISTIRAIIKNLRIGASISWALITISLSSLAAVFIKHICSSK